MRVIGTAGHVDHGKSALVEALTGIHPDRLKEEQEREMTIDLGFAWLSLPIGSAQDDEEVGIVDVPGHRDFIENMLAGIGGIDAALFVVAADEGVMPQTREHLAILDLLQIQGGVVALTKIDLIDDPDWLDLVEADLEQVMAGTVLEQAPIVRVSARSGAGIAELKRTLAEVLTDKPPRLDLNRPRLPVDRVFTIAGFGSVVTGTLTDGSLHVGEEVEVLPQKQRGRIRGLQTHKRKEQAAQPGSRTAVNISGVSLDQLNRGDVIAHPGDYRATQRIDVSFRLLPDVALPLKHNTEVKLFIGAAEIVARLRLLGSEELLPGEEGWLQLELSQATIAVRGDRYILRRPSPGETLGGGKVVDPHPPHRHKRFAKDIVARLAALAQGTPTDILGQALLASGAAPLKEVITRSNLDAGTAAQALQELVATRQLINLDASEQAAASDFKQDDLVISQGAWNQIATRIHDQVAKHHKTFPLKTGLPREELKSRIKDLTRNSLRLFNAALRKLVAEGAIEENGPLVAIPGHEIKFSAAQEAAIERLLARFESAPYSPPTLKESQSEVGEEVVSALVALGKLSAVPPDLLFRKQDYEKIVSEVTALIQKNGSITVAEARDHFNTSRRYVLALLEHLDATGVTVRDGDHRRLKR